MRIKVAIGSAEKVLQFQSLFTVVGRSDRVIKMENTLTLTIRNAALCMTHVVTSAWLHHDQGSITEKYPTGSVMDCFVDRLDQMWLKKWTRAVAQFTICRSDLKSVSSVFSTFVKSLTVSGPTPGQENCPTSRCSGVVVALPLSPYWWMWLIMSKCAEMKKMHSGI